MRKALIGIIFIISFISIFSLISFAAVDFPDMKDHWAYSSVKFLTEKKIISGREDGLFHPNEYVLSNEYIKMVVTALGYTDIQNYPGDWARNYIAKAKEIGLIYDGEIEDYYSPINRGMMAKIAMRALQDETIPEYITAYKGLISDYEQLNSDIRFDALKCIEKGIIKGMPDGSFKPDYYSTRAEAATVIHRMISQEEREKAKPVFAKPDPEFEAFMASEEAENYCSVELIDRVIDGKIIFGGAYQAETGELLLKTYYNFAANKEVYEVLRNLIMYAKENNHFVRVFLSSDSNCVYIMYYENNRYPKGPNWSSVSNFYLAIYLEPYKYDVNLNEYTYYTWRISNLAMQNVEDWESINYRSPELVKALEIGIKTIYGDSLGQKFFEFVIDEYDIERDHWFRQNDKNFGKMFIERREDLNGLEILYNRGFICTNKISN